MKLEDRCIYRLRSRNLSCGVFSAEKQLFIGIRDKFGNGMDVYLDQEYLYGPMRGTAAPIEPMNLFVPAEISLNCYLANISGPLGENTALFNFLKVPDALAAHKTEEEHFNKYVLNSIAISQTLEANNWAAKRMKAFHAGI